MPWKMSVSFYRLLRWQYGKNKNCKFWVLTSTNMPNTNSMLKIFDGFGSIERIRAV